MADRSSDEHRDQRKVRHALLANSAHGRRPRRLRERAHHRLEHRPPRGRDRLHPRQPTLPREPHDGQRAEGRSAYGRKGLPQAASSTSWSPGTCSRTGTRNSTRRSGSRSYPPTRSRRGSSQGSSGRACSRTGSTSSSRTAPSRGTTMPVGSHTFTASSLDSAGSPTRSGSSTPTIKVEGNRFCSSCPPSAHT